VRIWNTTTEQFDASTITVNEDGFVDQTKLSESDFYKVCASVSTLSGLTGECGCIYLTYIGP